MFQLLSKVVQTLWSLADSNPLEVAIVMLEPAPAILKTFTKLWGHVFKSMKPAVFNEIPSLCYCWLCKHLPKNVFLNKFKPNTVYCTYKLRFWHKIKVFSMSYAEKRALQPIRTHSMPLVWLRRNDSLTLSHRHPAHRFHFMLRGGGGVQLTGPKGAILKLTQLSVSIHEMLLSTVLQPDLPVVFVRSTVFQS